MGWREGEDLPVCTCVRVRAWNGVCARGMGGYSGDRTGLVRFFQRVVVRWRKRVGRRRLPPPLLIPYPVCTARVRAGKRRDACRRLHSAGPDAHQVVRSRSGQTVRPQRYCALFLSFSLSLDPSLVLTPCPVLLSTPLSLSLLSSLSGRLRRTLSLLRFRIPIRSYVYISARCAAAECSCRGT